MQYRKLKEIWYQKLQDSGFEDIESGHYLKEWHSHYFQTRIHPDLFQIKQQYFISATHFLISHVFENEIEKSIWELHAIGKSYREIADQLRPASKVKLNKDNINMIILKLRKLMLSSFGGEVTNP